MSYDATGAPRTWLYGLTADEWLHLAAEGQDSEVAPCCGDIAVLREYLKDLAVTQDGSHQIFVRYLLPSYAHALAAHGELADKGTFPLLHRVLAGIAADGTRTGAHISTRSSTPSEGVQAMDTAKPDIRDAQRIGDDDRRRMTDSLREFFASGHLSQEELDVRVDCVLRAVTEDDLKDLLKDLPVLRDQPGTAVRQFPSARLAPGIASARNQAERDAMAQMERRVLAQMEVQRMARSRMAGTVLNVAAYPAALAAIASAFIFLAGNNTWGPLLFAAGMIWLAVNLMWSGIRSES